MGFGATTAPLSFLLFSLVTRGATCASKQSEDSLDLGHQKAQQINSGEGRSKTGTKNKCSRVHAIDTFRLYGSFVFELSPLKIRRSYLRLPCPIQLWPKSGKKLVQFVMLQKNLNWPRDKMIDSFAKTHVRIYHWYPCSFDLWNVVSIKTPKVKVLTTEITRIPSKTRRVSYEWCNAVAKHVPELLANILSLQPSTPSLFQWVWSAGLCALCHTWRRRARAGKKAVHGS